MRPLLAALCLIGACTSAPTPTPQPAPGMLRVLALGDSYTIGEGVDAADRWPAQLAAALRADSLDVAPPDVIAQTGWTTDELDAGITAARPEGRFALVTLLIGVNNQYRGRSLDEYRAHLRGLLERAIGFAGGDATRVIVVSMPDWGVTAFADGHDRARIAREVDAFNEVARAEATAAGAAFVDITPISRAHPEAVVSDGLHPSPRQYGQWVESVLPAARRALAR